jgi:superfamily II DNA/RNA helicase
MFDAATAQLLRSAPGVPGLNPQEIPALLTKHFANLVSMRLMGAVDDGPGIDEVWSLERIADTYELITSLQTDGESRGASAFVAGVAQQILARRQSSVGTDDHLRSTIDRDHVDPAIAAIVLFLAAEQYADANEAASVVHHRQDGQQLYEATILSEDIVDLAQGQMQRILDRAERWRKPRRDRDLEERALAALLETLISGIEILAARFLAVPLPVSSSGRFDTAREAFKRVLEVSAVISPEANTPDLGGNVLNAFPGPHHLASLLIAAYDGVSQAALTALPPPDGADPDFWRQWLRFRANSFPFVWPNHREAIDKEFHETGKSAVVVLPTGAGKTTVSSLKIAGVLARGKKVIFLAPTHALVEQLTMDLQEMFPKDILGAVVSSEFDVLFQSDAQLQQIEVMTPERCLAMLCFAPEAFSEVGLLVFDECHLLSPQTGKVRRALDGMLCILGFNHIAPNADLLLLSAMLKNADEFAQWIGELTERECVCVDLLWKPSRQARGVLIYRHEDLNKAAHTAMAVQKSEDKRKGKIAKGLRAAAARQLAARPWAIWGLQHNWLGQKTPHYHTRQVLDLPVSLSGNTINEKIHLKPNANQVAVRLAVSAARNGLKSIVFVNTKHDAVSVAREISTELRETIVPNDSEHERWVSLRAELGDLKHALLSQPAIAVPHNSSMLRLERELSESMFKRANGSKVIVATPTLAQGLNLPAHLSILAGDKRADADQKGRESLEAHEILNAAARAGRAGHLANGIVLLIPEPIISFSDDKPPDLNVIRKLKSILPEDDRCVLITDPLEMVLDRIMQGDFVDPDVRYMVNRMAALREAEDFEEPTLLFDVRKSLAAFAARKRHAEKEFEAKITGLKSAIMQDMPKGADNAIAVLASQSGLSMELLQKLKKRVAGGVGSLPVSIEEWLIWTVDWLADDDNARASLLYGVKRSVLGACGAKKDGEIYSKEMKHILPGLLAWIKGHSIAAIEKDLGGDPETASQAEQICPRARELVGSVIPRGLSFIMGLVSHVVDDLNPFDAQENLSPKVIECLGTAVRKGYDEPEKVLYAIAHPAVLSRVRIHQLWKQENAFE